MLENATRICDAKFGVLQLLEGDGFPGCRASQCPACILLIMCDAGYFAQVRMCPLSRMSENQAGSPYRRHYDGGSLHPARSIGCRWR